MTGNSERSRDALRARVLPVIGWSEAKRNAGQLRSSWTCVTLRCCFTFGAMTKRKKGSGTPTDVFSQPPHLRDAARTLVSFPSPACGGGLGGGTLAYRRSTTALTVRAFAPSAQLQARLPGTWQDARSCKPAPTGVQRPHVLTRALPAPACPSPGNAPPGPVVVPVSMMPEAARVRSVSFRARAPHSLHLSEYLRDRRPR